MLGENSHTLASGIVLCTFTHLQCSRPCRVGIINTHRIRRASVSHTQDTLCKCVRGSSPLHDEHVVAVLSSDGSIVDRCIVSWHVTMSGEQIDRKRKKEGQMKT